MTAGWTTYADLVAVLRRRWTTGNYLRSYAAGEPWTPRSLPVTGPKSVELLDRLIEVNAWVERLTADCAATPRRPGLRIESAAVLGPRRDRNVLPKRAWVDDYDQLFGLLGVRAEIRRLDGLLVETGSRVPTLLPWVRHHPRTALEQEAEWSRLLAAVDWISAHGSSSLYLRQVDVPGVDTKFLERNHDVLAELLDTVLPTERIDDRYGRRELAGRYGFRRKPLYTRIRFLAPQQVLPAGISEVTLRAEELAHLDPGLARVIIVENEISYLALPPRPDTLAIFGSGFALGSVAGFTWLQDKIITYWGDIDTYGFVILNRLRARFPHVESILMDTATLLAHPSQWVPEEKPTRLDLPHLSTEEAAVYRDLVEDRWGPHLRLEQERVRFSLVRAALEQTSGGFDRTSSPGLAEPPNHDPAAVIREGRDAGSDMDRHLL